MSCLSYLTAESWEYVEGRRLGNEGERTIHTHFEHLKEDKMGLHWLIGRGGHNIQYIYNICENGYEWWDDFLHPPTIVPHAYNTGGH